MEYHYFDPFTLDVQQRILLFEGTPVPVPLKAYETLLALVECAGRAVLNKDLLDRVWPDSFVEENSLSQNVSLLRRTLNEPQKVVYMETVPKRGFRFVGDVTYVASKLPTLAAVAVMLWQSRVTLGTTFRIPARAVQRGIEAAAASNSTVRDLVAGAGFRFENRGALKLIGEAGEMAVYGVVR